MQKGQCNGKAQYAVILGQYKLLVGGGGLPNQHYHDGLPYKGNLPTPNGGCLVACTKSTTNASEGCLAMPDVQVFDLFEDEAELHNLAPTSPSLVKRLMSVLHKYNSSQYVESLLVTKPEEARCPQELGPRGVLTPCEKFI